MYPHRLIEESLRVGEKKSADHLLSQLRTEVPGLVAAGLVDLDSGEWIVVETTDRFPEEFLSYLAATAKAYFEGDAVRTIKTVLDESSPGETHVREIEEIMIRSTNHLYFLERLEEKPRWVLAVVTTREPKLGLIRTALTKSVKDVRLR